MKTLCLAGAIAISMIGHAVPAQTAAPYGHTTAIKGGSGRVMPSADHQGQWWTHPKGCEYSRTGRPGETVWYLIINTARAGCPTYIATRGGADVY